MSNSWTSPLLALDLYPDEALRVVLLRACPTDAYCELLSSEDGSKLCITWSGESRPADTEQVGLELLNDALRAAAEQRAHAARRG